MKRLTTFITSIFLLALVHGQTKISELSSATGLGSGDLFVVVQSSTTRNMTGAVLMGAVSDTADAIRQAISDSIATITVDNIDIDSGAIDQYHFAVGAVNSFYMQNVEAYESATGTPGDSLVQRIDWPFVGVRDKIKVKAIFGNGGQNDNFGKIKVFNSSGAAVLTEETPALYDQGNVTGILEFEVTILNTTTIGVLRKLSYYTNSPSQSVTVYEHDYSTYSVGSSIDSYLEIYINADDIGFRCWEYSAEIMFYDSKYYEWIQNN